MAINQATLSARRWRKSSYSNGSGGNCVEAAARWRTSSHSNGDGRNCVEVAVGTPQGIVPVRDTKTAPDGPALTFPAVQWAHFIDALHTGALTA
ncbi:MULTISPECIES: DUF397 domain-containing protein [unclassified Streptomyces]|uniref:DUF397 domain-containing protein n=1 Tax=unclassified Streptomyces TaxID=2593676 RepID=UPI002E148DA4|nr:DUF397 domain-containing protein [Streptomyces sp. NBC_01186]WSS44473.1 DUF397 domain-containing protein [Streptomyces sp. NBC_01187]